MVPRDRLDLWAVLGSRVLPDSEEIRDLLVLQGRLDPQVLPDRLDSPEIKDQLGPSVMLEIKDNRVSRVHKDHREIRVQWAALVPPVQLVHPDLPEVLARLETLDLRDLVAGLEPLDRRASRAIRDLLDLRDQRVNPDLLALPDLPDLLDLQVLLERLDLADRRATPDTLELLETRAALEVLVLKARKVRKVRRVRWVTRDRLALWVSSVLQVHLETKARLARLDTPDTLVSRVRPVDREIWGPKERREQLEVLDTPVRPGRRELVETRGQRVAPGPRVPRDRLDLRAHRVHRAQTDLLERRDSRVNLVIGEPLECLEM